MDRVRIGAVSRNYFNLPLWLAHHGGLFGAEGIEAEIQLIESIDETNNAIASGVLDIGLSVTENVILEIESGGAMKILGGNVNKLPFSFIAAPEIASFEDLRGKRIGVSSIRAGSSSIVMELLSEHGLRHPDDYELVACGPILARWEMLQSGQIQAGLQGIPLNYVAIDQGYRELGRIDERYPFFQFTSLNAGLPWIEASHGLLVRFLKAFLRAHDTFFAERALSTEIALRETGLSEAYAARAWEEYSRDEVFPRDGRCSEQGVEALMRVSGLIRSLPGRLDTRAADYIDHSYLEEAAAQIERPEA